MSSAIKNVLCKSCLIIALGLTFVLAGHAYGQQQIVDLRVDGDNGLPGGDGLTWATAFRFLQDALTRAEELVADPNITVRLWVAATVPINTYRPDRDAANPDGTGDRNATFLLDFNNVQLLGGFDGTETLPEDRDAAGNVTVLSGDITNPLEGVCGEGNGPCFEPNPTPGCEDAACCEIVCEIDPLCCLEGFQWTQACANIAIANCPMTDNSYHVVTAIGVDSSVQIDGFTITDGAADFTAPEPHGGGMLLDHADLNIIRCRFVANSGVDGAGFSSRADENDQSFPSIINCEFRANEASDFGGGALSNTIRTGWVNCIFADNTAGLAGGGMFMIQGTTEELVNCTFADNSAGVSGGGLYLSQPFGQPNIATIIRNSIFWGNQDNGGMDESAQIFMFGQQLLTVEFSNVQGEWSGMGSNNIGEDPADDPLFVDPGNDDYRLTIASPSIDTGDNDGVVCDEFDLDNDGRACLPPDDEGTPDLDLINRVLDGKDDGEAIVDMGSYEFIHPNVCPCADICPWDLNGDCEVGVADLLILLANWANPYGVPDLLEMLADWFGCPCNPAAEVLSLQEELDDACLTQENWDDFVDVMQNGNPAEKNKYLCWMIHYLDHCPRCTCTHIPLCPGPDPFG